AASFPTARPTILPSASGNTPDAAPAFSANPWARAAGGKNSAKEGIRNMAIEQVKEYFRQFGREGDVMGFPVSSATVELAAQALGTEPGRIAKTISLYGEEGECLLILAAGDRKIVNAKFKQTFHKKAKMLSFEDVEPMT